MDKLQNSKTSKSSTSKDPQTSATESHSYWAYDVEMHRKIEVEAYLRAEKDGFAGNAHDYWVVAEKEVGCSMP